MLYRAKTLVTYGCLRQVGEVFDVDPIDASKNGWDRENATVEQVVEPLSESNENKTISNGTQEQVTPAAPAEQTTQTDGATATVPAEAPAETTAAAPAADTQ